MVPSGVRWGANWDGESERRPRDQVVVSKVSNTGGEIKLAPTVSDGWDNGGGVVEERCVGLNCGGGRRVHALEKVSPSGGPSGIQEATAVCHRQRPSNITKEQ
jgi:hypothetical protein